VCVHKFQHANVLTRVLSTGFVYELCYVDVCTCT